jgi:hypothetical protein
MPETEPPPVTLPPGRSEGSTPAFSFLTSAYRCADTLGRTIAAVRSQIRDDWELVVVDNGNDPLVAAIVRPHLGDRRICLVRQENRGPTGGVMTAATMASGRYLVVLNADDAVTPEFCERLGLLLDAAPEVAAVTCDAHLFTDPGTRLRRHSYLESAGMRVRPDPRRPLRLAEIIDGPCPYYSAAVRRDVWDAVGGLECDTPIVDDLAFWLRVVGAGYDVRMLPDRLGLFRMEQGSISRPNDSGRAEAFEAQREQALVEAARASGAPEDLAALSRVLRRLQYFQAVRRARQAFVHGDAAAARRHARRAFGARRTPRTGLILLALTVAPRLLGLVHPAKQWLDARLRVGRVRAS